ncbi:hypothetical protein VCR12J2_630032 [Vibrio coralliirubri]|uniref:Uncharacterized protein n=1 Tax=Vibrio coralliirubri TaxID=1516159 RepID=A0AA86XSR3_9VIBR|nr:hypothetical protein VCR31J2_1360136 [Vibrio coralliirubri]CDU03091.1 hypothetical protein VCR12J2_630032 [Vibrio coralliirubri]
MLCELPVLFLSLLRLCLLPLCFNVAPERAGLSERDALSERVDMLTTLQKCKRSVLKSFH